MKLSVELYSVAKIFGDLKAIELIKQAGFEAIDYSYYYEKECEEVLGENYKEYAQELRAHLDRVGLSCNQALPSHKQRQLLSLPHQTCHPLHQL